MRFLIVLAGFAFASAAGPSSALAQAPQTYPTQAYPTQGYPSQAVAQTAPVPTDESTAADFDRFRVLIGFQAGLGSADATQREGGRLRDSAEYDLHFSPGFLAQFMFLPVEFFSVGPRFEFLNITGDDGIDLDTPQISVVAAGLLPIGEHLELFLEGLAGVAFTIQTDGEDLESPKLGARAGAYFDFGSFGMRAAVGHEWYFLQNTDRGRVFKGQIRLAVFDLSFTYDF